MAQRVDERTPTRTELEAYNTCLKLNDHVLSVCKPKDKNVNNHHIPKRNLGLARQLMDNCVELGADILEANEIYVGANMHTEQRLANYAERIRIQDHARRLTYRMEHIFRVLHFDKPFAESTTKYMMDLLCETRALIIAWKDSDIRDSRKLEKAARMG